MSTDLNYFAFPSRADGISVTADGAVVVGLAQTSHDIWITKITYHQTHSSFINPDTTQNHLITLYIDRLQQGTIKLSFPCSTKRDDATAQFLMTQNFFLPEPYFVPRGSRITFDVWDDSGFAGTTYRIKFQYMAKYELAANPALPENFKRVGVGNGMGTTEKTN